MLWACQRSPQTARFGAPGALCSGRDDRVAKRLVKTTIAGLDIGTTKTCAVVATSSPEGLDIIGVGEAPSTGLRKGVITELEETVRAIEAATERAERMAGVHISHVYVGVTGEHVHSTNNRGVVAISGDDEGGGCSTVRPYAFACVGSALHQQADHFGQTSGTEQTCRVCSNHTRVGVVPLRCATTRELGS